MHRCSRRGQKGWAVGPSPPLPCGQLMRCFSAVAELLVLLEIEEILLWMIKSTD